MVIISKSYDNCCKIKTSCKDKETSTTRKNEEASCHIYKNPSTQILVQILSDRTDNHRISIMNILTILSIALPAKSRRNIFCLVLYLRVEKNS